MSTNLQPGKSLKKTFPCREFPCRNCSCEDASRGKSSLQWEMQTLELEIERILMYVPTCSILSQKKSPPPSSFSCLAHILGRAWQRRCVQFPIILRAWRWRGQDASRRNAHTHYAEGPSQVICCRDGGSKINHYLENLGKHTSHRVASIRQCRLATFILQATNIGHNGHIMDDAAPWISIDGCVRKTTCIVIA